MRPFTTKLIAAAADADGIALAQTKDDAGNLTIDGALATNGVATLNTDYFATKVTLASTGDLHGVNFTITGTDQYGNIISEIIAGPNNNTVTTTNYFKTVTQIAVSGAVGTEVTVGNANATVSPWFIPNRHQVVNMGIGVQVGGTVNYTIQMTFDNIMDLPVLATNQYTFNNTDFTTQTTSKYGSVLFPVGAIRIILASSGGATTDFAKMTIIDSGMGPAF